MVQPAGISSSHPVVDNLIALMGVGEAIIIVALGQLGTENRVESREMMRKWATDCFHWFGNAKLKEVEIWKRFLECLGSSKTKSLHRKVWLPCQALSFH